MNAPQSEKEQFAYQVYAVIAAIPKSKVTTYGTIAKLTGKPTYIRQVCQILRSIPNDSLLPCHRIINKQGKLSVTGDTYARHKKKLIAEGIIFNERDVIDLKKFGWCLDD